jgi:hypothetical protein
MPVLRGICLLALLLGAPSASAAQTASPPLRGPAPSLLFGARADGPLRTGWAADSVRPLSRTYVKEGAIVGGVLGAVAGGFFAMLACGLSEDSNKSCTGTVLLGGILGAPFGALPGALIGGLFPKHPTPKRF